MVRRKLKHINQVKQFANVFNSGEEVPEEWQRGPVVLELGCGGGQYTLALARRWPERRFVGMDKKGDRIWHPAVEARDCELENVAFARGLIEGLGEFFDEGAVEEIWVTFPDPFPKPSKAGRRLVAPVFLETYKKVLCEGGLLHLKTDNLPLFEYGLECVREAGFEVLEEIRDVHSQPQLDDVLKIETYYESVFKKEGREIYYFKCRYRGGGQL